MELDVSMLKKGMLVKNYKEMCSLLEQEQRTGKSKQLQMKDWDRYFKYSKQGNKLLINEIYENPIPKIDLRSGGNYSKYINEIADILVYWLSYNTENCNYNFSLAKLIEITCMANSAFAVGNRFREAASAVLNLPKEEVEIFFTDMRSEFKDIIERALNILQSRCVLLVKNSITVFDIKKQCHRLATEEEEKQILNWEKEALSELGLKDKRDMFLKRKLYQFNMKMREYLSEINCKYCYHSYNLTVGKTALILEKERLEKQRKSLNNKCVNRACAKFNSSDTATILINSFVDSNTNCSSLKSRIEHQQKNIEEAKNQKMESLQSIRELIEAIIEEGEENNNKYSYAVDSITKRSVYNKLSKNEKEQIMLQELFG